MLPALVSLGSPFRGTFRGTLTKPLGESAHRGTKAAATSVTPSGKCTASSEIDGWIHRPLLQPELANPNLLSLFLRPEHPPPPLKPPELPHFSHKVTARNLVEAHLLGRCLSSPSPLCRGVVTENTLDPPESPVPPDPPPVYIEDEGTTVLLLQVVPFGGFSSASVCTITQVCRFRFVFLYKNGDLVLLESSYDVSSFMEFVSPTNYLLGVRGLVTAVFSLELRVALIYVHVKASTCLCLTSYSVVAKIQVYSFMESFSHPIYSSMEWFLQLDVYASLFVTRLPRIEDCSKRVLNSFVVKSLIMWISNDLYCFVETSFVISSLILATCRFKISTMKTALVAAQGLIDSRMTITTRYCVSSILTSCAPALQTAQIAAPFATIRSP